MSDKFDDISTHELEVELNIRKKRKDDAVFVQYTIIPEIMKKLDRDERFWLLQIIQDEDYLTHLSFILNEKVTADAIGFDPR